MLRNKRTRRRILVEEVRELLKDYLVVKGRVVQKGDCPREIIEMVED